MWWIVVVSVLVGVGRFLIPGHDLSWSGTYEAFAHIWIGALFVFAFQYDFNRPSRRDLSRWSLVLLTVLETMMFLLFKKP